MNTAGFNVSATHLSLRSQRALNLGSIYQSRLPVPKENEHNINNGFSFVEFGFPFVKKAFSFSRKIAVLIGMEYAYTRKQRDLSQIPIGQSLRHIQHHPQPMSVHQLKVLPRHLLQHINQMLRTQQRTIIPTTPHVAHLN